MIHEVADIEQQKMRALAHGKVPGRALMRHVSLLRTRAQTPFMDRAHACSAWRVVAHRHRPARTSLAAIDARTLPMGARALARVPNHLKMRQ